MNNPTGPLVSTGKSFAGIARRTEVQAVRNRLIQEGVDTKFIVGLNSTQTRARMVENVIQALRKLPKAPGGITPTLSGDN
jgi:hypothetical protein